MVGSKYSRCRSHTSMLKKEVYTTVLKKLILIFVEEWMEY